MALLKLKVAATAGGASEEVAGILDEDPMCMQTTVLVSWHAAKSGSQCPVWMLGRPRWGGISLKQTALVPRSALRLTSLAAPSTSHRGMMQRGISRPWLSP